MVSERMGRVVGGVVDFLEGVIFGRICFCNSLDMSGMINTSVDFSFFIYIYYYDHNDSNIDIHHKWISYPKQKTFKGGGGYTKYTKYTQFSISRHNYQSQDPPLRQPLPSLSISLKHAIPTYHDKPSQSFLMKIR